MMSDCANVPTQNKIHAAPPKKISNARALARVDLLNSICWLHMDACWMLGWSAGAYVLATLTILTGFLTFRYVRRDITTIFVTMAINAWALMNASWMCSELAKEPALLIAAKTFFIAGDLCLVGALLSAKSRGEVVSAVFDRFRRLRFWRKEDALR
jgi:hypothetical protein